MNSTTDSFSRVAELEARQDEALAQLAELERKLDAVLAEAQPSIARPIPAAAGPAPLGTLSFGSPPQGATV